MMKFFIDLYESIIEIYNHLDPDNQSTNICTSKNDNTNNHSSHYIITIQEPYRTYDTLLNEQAPYSLKQLATDIHHTVIPIAQPFHSASSTPPTSQTSQTSQASTTVTITPSKYEDVKLDESTMNILNHRIIEDYFVIPEGQTNAEEDWEFIANEV